MFRLTALAVAALLAPPAPAADPFRYPEAKAHDGELKTVAGVPVLTVGGTPAEIGRQVAVLAVAPATRLMGYPDDVLKAQVPVGRAAVWAKLIEKGEGLLAHFPADHKAEFDAMAAAGAPREKLVAANTMFDLKNVGLATLFGCSSVIVPAADSATGGPLFGRNLDFTPHGYLHEFGLVTVYRPAGKRAFAAVGFTGVVGCFSGMNDAGLCVASHEVFTPHADRTFDPTGLPFAIAYRRLLEECETVAEAEALLRTLPRATTTLLVLCDTAGGAVLEVTPDRVVRRLPEPGVCACSNHFTTPELAAKKQANQYKTVDRLDTLRAPGPAGKSGVADVQKRLHAAHQGELTLQTMVFDPAALTVHLALGQGPTTARKLTPLKLRGLFAGR